MTLEVYDNTLPLFLGGPFQGEIRLVRGNQELLVYPRIETSAGFSYQRWVLAAGGREWVFYRSLGMSDADALAALVQLAASSPKEPQRLDVKSLPVPCGPGDEKETKNENQTDTVMWKKVINVLKNALELAKADPADKQEIRRLTQANSDLAQELAAAMAACPSNEDRDEIASLLDSFAAAVPQVESVSPAIAEAVTSEPTGPSGDVAPPTTPYPGAVTQEWLPPAATPADSAPEAPVEAQAEAVPSVETPAADAGSSE